MCKSRAQEGVSSLRVSVGDRLLIEGEAGRDWEFDGYSTKGGVIFYGETMPGVTDERVVTTLMVRLDRDSGDFLLLDNREPRFLFRGDCSR